MVYVDTTLTVQGGYSFIHAGQIYNLLADAMIAQGNWEYLEFGDWVNGPNTFRRYVWRCKASGSGLSSDFFVVIEVPFATSGGLFLTNWANNVYLGETYSGGVLRKYATYSGNGAITPDPDLTNPITFSMTLQQPSSTYMWGQGFGNETNTTSLRMIYLVGADSIIITRSRTSGASASNPNYLMYVGAYERVMSAAADPMPLVLMSTSTTASSRPGGFTRALEAAAGVPATDTFGAASYNDGSTTPIASSGPGRNYMSPPTGQPGTAATTTYWKNLGPTVSRCPVNSWLNAATDGSTKGVFRGYMKNIVCANLAAHSYGDTFRVDGKVYAGIGVTGNAPLIDTTGV